MALLITSILPCCSAQDDTFLSPLIMEIQALHDKSVAGDKEATKALVQKMEKLSADHSDNKLFLAYLGSAYTLKSRDLFPGPSKFHFLKEGLATMDRAVEAAPENIPVRFIRAMNNFNLPAFIGRRDTGRKDFDHLVHKLDSGKVQVDPLTAQAIYYFAGLSYKQLDQPDKARTCWQKGYKLNARKDVTEKISGELQKLES